MTFALDPAAIRDRLLGRQGHGLSGDHHVATVLRSDPIEPAPIEPAPIETVVTPPEVRRAAVLVPLVQREQGMTVLLTRRTDHLHHHAGQISFPGGGLEPEDQDLIACALRETEEEIGLPRAQVEVLGQLDDYLTITSFCVTPVVGLIMPPLDLRPDSFEVAEVFEVPLDFILEPAHHQQQERVSNGRTRRFWAIPYGDYYIWGATAAMLMNLYRVLRDEH